MYEIPSDIVPRDETKKRHLKAFNRNMKIAEIMTDEIMTGQVFLFYFINLNRKIYYFQL